MLGNVARQIAAIAEVGMRRGVRQSYRLLSNVMDVQGRTLPQHVAHAIAAGTMYLSLVDLPSVVGGTTPIMVAGQAALASTALSNMLIFLNRAAYDMGAQGNRTLERDFYEWVSSKIGNLVDWSTEYLSRAPQNAETAQLRRAVQDVNSAVERNDPWAQRARMTRGMGLLLGPAAIAGPEREGIEGPPTPMLDEPQGQTVNETAGGTGGETPGGSRRRGVVLEDREREELMATMQDRYTPAGVRKDPTAMNKDYVYTDGKILRYHHGGQEVYIQLLPPRGTGGR